VEAAPLKIPAPLREVRFEQNSIEEPLKFLQSLSESTLPGSVASWKNNTRRKHLPQPRAVHLLLRSKELHKLRTTRHKESVTAKRRKRHAKSGTRRPETDNEAPLRFSGRAGGIFFANDPAPGYAGILGASTKVRWIFSNSSSRSLISRDALVKAGLMTGPYEETLHKIDSRDRVEISDVYSDKPMQGIRGKIRVPFELLTGQGLDILHHDFFISDTLAVRSITRVSLV